MFIKQLLVLFAIFMGINTGLSVEEDTKPSEEPIPSIPIESGVFKKDYGELAIGKRLESWKSGDKQNAWELSGLFEGDIMTSSDPIPAYGFIDERLRWPHGIVPYYIKPEDFSRKQRAVILGAMKEIQNRTCIRFRPYEWGDENFVVVQGSNAGCWSNAGRQNSRGQLVNLQSSACVVHGIAIHELMHSLGFLHEQSAPDRDEWIQILWRNVQRGSESQFHKFDPSEVTNFGAGYDYNSIMHYGPYAFSKNGAPTIQPKMPNAKIGQISHMSEKDVIRVQEMYKFECSARRRSSLFRISQKKV